MSNEGDEWALVEGLRRDGIDPEKFIGEVFGFHAEPEECQECGHPVRISIQKGTGYCSSRCDPERRTSAGRAGGAKEV